MKDGRIVMKKVLCVFLVTAAVMMLAGTAFAADAGWNYGSRGWWYQNDNGSYPVNTWKEIDGKWYRFDSYGFMRTGWILESYGLKYYCRDDGSMATGWVNVNGTWYYFNSDGSMATGWVKDDGSWYYLDAEGRVVTGWFQEDDNWYYCYSDGRMALGGWVSLDGTLYYFNSNGTLLDGHNADYYAKAVLDQVGWDLYSAYMWAVNLPYYRTYTGNTVAASAEYGFKFGYGDCVSKAATFCVMARLLGYDIVVIYGQVPYEEGGYGAHAWTEIQYNGGTYVCDPEFESDEGRNGYMINYGQSGTWRYVWEYVMSDF